MNYTEHRYLSHDGLSLYYRSYGSGDNVVVCLPGLSRNSKDFENLAVHLSSRPGMSWRVISPDFRGRGQSDRDSKPSRYHPGTYARDTFLLLDGLDIQRFAVIGTSLGGLTAMVMADLQGERLRGVVINDIAPEIPHAAVSRILQYVGRTPPAPDWESASVQIRTNHENALPGLPDDFWRSYVHFSYRQDASGQIVPDMDPAIGDALRRNQRILSVLRWFRRHGLKRKVAGFNIDPWDSFRAMSMPCLLVHGILSDVLTTELAARMKATKPEMELLTLPDRGHAPLLDEADARLAIDGFLDRLPGAG